MATNRIAVYGTLRRGSFANSLMKGCKFLGSDKIYGKLYNLGRFPGIKLGTEEEANKVSVDVYEIPSDIERVKLAEIDRYEGYFPDASDQSLYRRHIVLTVDSNEEVFVYEYLFPVRNSQLIESGDWFDVSK